MGLAVKLLQAVASANLAGPQIHSNWYQMCRIRRQKKRLSAGCGQSLRRRQYYAGEIGIAFFLKSTLGNRTLAYKKHGLVFHA